MSNGKQTVSRHRRPLFLNKNEGEKLELVLSMLPRELARQLEGWMVLTGKNSYAPNSRRALLSDWADFARWAKESRRLPFITLANPSDLSKYFDDHGHLSKATLERRQSHLMKLFKILEHPQTPAIRENMGARLQILHGEKREVADRNQTIALRWNDIKRILGALDPGHSVWDARARLALCLSYDAMLRSSELANLRVKDFRREVEETQNLGEVGGCLHIAQDVNDGNNELDVLFCSKPTAQYLERWVDTLGLSSMNHLVCRLDELGNPEVDHNRPLEISEISQILKQAAAQAGLAREVVAKISGLSPRVGMVKDLLKDGRGVTEVMHFARWKSPQSVRSHAQDFHNVQYATRIMGHR